MPKTYYFVNHDADWDAWFGSQDPVCMSESSVAWLAREWEVPLEELMDQLHEATDEEIAEYGIWDSEE